MGTKWHPRGLALGGVFLAVLAVGGCAVKATPYPTTSVPTAATTVVPSKLGTTPLDLRGTYKANVEGTTATPGLWTLTITETDVLITNPHGTEAFSVDPTEVTETLMMVAPVQDCPDQSEVTAGQYSISLLGDKLTFTVLQDSCGDRKAVLSTVPWTHQP